MTEWHKMSEKFPAHGEKALVWILVPACATAEWDAYTRKWVGLSSYQSEHVQYWSPITEPKK